MRPPDVLQLLVSVRDESEAADALAGGANWIDFKEPWLGSLGAVSADVAEQMTHMVRGRCPLSAALGELSDWPQANVQQLLAIAEIRVVKLGLRGCADVVHWQAQWRSAFETAHAAGKQLAAVIYADWQAAAAPAPAEVLQLALDVGCRYLLIDTYHKQNESSVDILSWAELARVLHISRQGGMTTVLAGNLKIANLLQVAELPVEMVAVRGAVCQGTRTGRVDKNLVREFRRRLSCITARGQARTVAL
jgi:(5-formylfuran-3-yl)methyl phosphate synthase